MSAREFTVWLISLSVVLPLAGVASGGGPAANDPWATMRGCTRILERMVACQSHPSFKRVVASWCDLNTVPTITEQQVRTWLAAWRKADARRLSCAVWTGRPGAAEQVGERSALGRLAVRQAGCEDFNHQLERTTWVRANLADEP
jgi:hypothetical protein